MRNTLLYRNPYSTDSNDTLTTPTTPSPSPPRSIPTIRLVSATPSAAGSSSSSLLPPPTPPSPSSTDANTSHVTRRDWSAESSWVLPSPPPIHVPAVVTKSKHTKSVSKSMISEPILIPQDEPNWSSTVIPPIAPPPTINPKSKSKILPRSQLSQPPLLPLPLNQQQQHPNQPRKRIVPKKSKLSLLPTLPTTTTSSNSRRTDFSDVVRRVGLGSGSGANTGSLRSEIRVRVGSGGSREVVSAFTGRKGDGAQSGGRAEGDGDGGY
ncbi:hypothetical protein PILCRDRAFT_681294, partial [Piloderma croceum F 1598]